MTDENGCKPKFSIFPGCMLLAYYCISMFMRLPSQRALLRASALHNHCRSHKFLSLFHTTFRFCLISPLEFHTDNGHTSSCIPHNIEPDNRTEEYNLVKMIKNCIINGYISYGKQLHCYALRSGFASNVYVSTVLVSFYVKVASLDDAHKVFDEMTQRNVVSWNALISGYVRCGMLWKALLLFIELDKSEILADAYSFTAALAACGQLSMLRLSRSIHSRIIVYGLESSVVVANCLIDVYGKCGWVEGAIAVFNCSLVKDVISWNSVIAACVRNQRLDLAFDYFHRMPCRDTVSYNELINGVSKFGDLDEAIEILRIMPEPNSSSWNAIISGYVVRDRAKEALDFFTEMHVKRIAMDEFTFSSILSGIACLSALKWGALVHACTIKHGLASSTIIGSALIDMYSKCGQVKDAEMVFYFLPQKNIVAWNALISGLAHNGEPHKVVEYFEELKTTQGLKPDQITFVNVLAACSQNQQQLSKAYEYLMSMINDYGIKPMPEHLASVIRLLGHHGELHKAEKLIIDLGLVSYAAVWRALLGACAACGDLEVAKVAAARLSKLENNDEIWYVILSNVNKVCEKWDDATAVWDLMANKGLVKETGFSWVDVRTPIR